MRGVLPLAWLVTVQLGQAGHGPNEGVLLAQLASLRSRPETAARLGAESRLLFFLAEAVSDSRRQEELHAEGLAVADRGRTLDPEEPSVQLWWAAHRGSQATPLNPFAALKIAREVEEVLLRLRDEHPGYEHGAPDRALGRLYQLAPRGISIGSTEKAATHLRAALDRDPRFPANALFYAQFLAARRDCDGARQWALRVLQSPELPAHPLEQGSWVRDAQKVLAGLRGRCRAEDAWP